MSTLHIKCLYFCHDLEAMPAVELDDDKGLILFLW